MNEAGSADQQYHRAKQRYDTAGATASDWRRRCASAAMQFAGKLGCKMQSVQTEAETVGSQGSLVSFRHRSDLADLIRAISGSNNKFNV